MTPASLELSTHKPILACMNFCRESEVALLTAARLAESAGAPLVVLHVVHEPANRPGYYRRTRNGEALLPIEEIAERMLREFLVEISARHPAQGPALAQAGIRLVAGLPETRILEVARNIDAQQILMGSNGRGSLARLFSGSVSDQVARHGSIPVTVVHAGPEAWDLAGDQGDCHRFTEPLALR